MQLAVRCHFDLIMEERESGFIFRNFSASVVLVPGSKGRAAGHESYGNARSCNRSNGG